MNSTSVGAFILAMTSLAGPCSPTFAQSSAQKSSSSQTAALTPQEREAQKHYRIALEALKNNDLSTATDELDQATQLAPKNAVIWYNLAQVESKKGDSKLALEHLRKAESLRLPKNLSNDADQLEAKLSYEVESAAKKEAFSAKLLELQKQIQDGAKFGGSGYCNPSLTDTYSQELVPFSSPSTNALLKLLDVRCNGNGCSNTYPNLTSRNENTYIETTIALADFVTDVKVVEQSNGFCRRISDGSLATEYWVSVMAEPGKSFHAKGNSIVNVWQGFNTNTVNPIEGDFSELRIRFPQREAAEATAQNLRDAILMSKSLH